MNEMQQCKNMPVEEDSVLALVGKLVLMEKFLWMFSDSKMANLQPIPTDRPSP